VREAHVADQVVDQIDNARVDRILGVVSDGPFGPIPPALRSRLD
jgi:hypothetical protein